MQDIKFEWTEYNNIKNDGGPKKICASDLT